MAIDSNNAELREMFLKHPKFNPHKAVAQIKQDQIYMDTFFDEFEYRLSKIPIDIFCTLNYALFSEFKSATDQIIPLTRNFSCVYAARVALHL